MSTRWAIAFVVATWVAIAGNALLRRLARSSSSWRASEYWGLQLRLLGGPVLAVATLLGTTASPSFTGRLGIALGAAALIAVFGLLDYRRDVPGMVRQAVILAAAIAVVAGGMRVAVLSSSLLDALLTIGWIVLITNAFRRLDHVEGLAVAIAGISAAALFGVSAIAANAGVATLCVALAGGCLGLVVYNWRPASTVLGPSGASFAGFVLAFTVVEFRPDRATPGGLLIPFLVFGLPVLDLVCVTCSRLWRGIPLSRRRPDHLLHRFRRKGWSRDRSIAALLSAQALLCGLAVLVARDFASPWLGLLVGIGILLVVVLAGVPEARVEYRSRTRGRLVLEVAACVLFVVAVLGALAVVQGMREVQAAQSALTRALDVGRAGDTEQAQVEFARAERHFDRANTWVSGPLGVPGRLIPVVAENFRAARELSSGGQDVARAGVELAGAANTRLQVSDGTVRLDAVRQVTPEIEAAAGLLDQIVRRVDDLYGPYLVGPVRDRVSSARRELDQAVGEAENAVAAAHVAPAVFGADRPRQYFLAIQNNAELRATGGIIGNWGILTAANGKVTLEDVYRTRLLNEDPIPRGGSTRQLEAPEDYVQRYARFTPAQIWQNLNMSPDFPTVGKLVQNLYPQSGGGPIDGVIAVDPVGLQALLELTGPIPVEAWPTLIDAENVIDVTLRQAYDVFDQAEREEFLGDVAEAVWDRAISSRLGSPARIARKLGDAARQGHLILWFTDPEEQALAERLGIAGAAPRPRSDELFVTTQNASGNKVDYYLTRQMSYDVDLRPDDQLLSAEATGRLVVTLNNGAPSSGAAQYALGPFDERFAPGEDRSFASVYSSLGFTGATLDGQPTALETATELGRNVYSQFVSVLSRTSRTLALDLEGTVALDRGGWYTLDVVHQPTLLPDDVGIRIEVPPGWEIRDAKGIDLLGPRRAGGRIAVSESRQIRVRIGRDPQVTG